MTKERHEEYDPYADLIASNQEEILRVHQEAIRRVSRLLDRGDVALAKMVLFAVNQFHPMHIDSWAGWPEGSDQ